MDTVIRAFAVYVFLMVVFRIAGTRTVAHITMFDFVLLIIIAKAWESALVGHDFSFTNAALLVLTFIGLNIAFSVLTFRNRLADKLIDGMPLILVENGEPIEEHLAKSRVTTEEIMMSARERLGIERMDQIKYAVLERNGGISVVPSSPIPSR